MDINLLDPENIKRLIDELDSDCAARLVLAALSGKTTFLKQLNVECVVQSRRDQESKALTETAPPQTECEPKECLTDSALD